MKKIKLIIKSIIIVFAIFIANSTIIVNKATAQCSIDATVNGQFSSTYADTFHICEGDAVAFQSTGTCGQSLMNNDFNNQTIGTGWVSNCNPQFNNPCDPSPDGTPYLWVGSSVTQPRRLTTVAYSGVTTACTICFDMDYATQGDASPCEGPDLSDEGVHLQYSTDGGTTWVDINYWDPNGGNDPYLTAWHNYCENVPINPSGNIQFSWYQDVGSGSGFDHWGIDNVVISCPAPQEVVTWTGPGGWSYNDWNPPAFVPTQSGWYAVSLTDSTYVGSDSIYIVIHPDPVMGIAYSAPGYGCENGAPITLTGTPAPGSVPGSTGTFSGSGVSGNTFDPQSVGPGTYTITYTFTDLCAHTFDSTITVYAAPNAAFTVTPICAGDPSDITFTGSTQGSSNYNWNFNGGTVLSGSNQGPYQVTWNTPGNITVTLEVTNQYGCTDTASNIVTVLPASSPVCCTIPEPNAGPDDGTCGLSYDLQGTASWGQGSWSMVSGPGSAIFSDANDAVTNVIVTDYGQYVFQWHEVNGSQCDSSDQVTIDFVEQPQANAGIEDETCSYTYTLNGIQSATGSTAHWSGPGSFLNSNAFSTDVTVGASGNYTFTLIETNSSNGTSCYDTATVEILFKLKPPIDLGPNDSICGNSYSFNNSFTASGNTGYWEGPSGTLFSPSDNPTTTASVNYGTNSYTAQLIWHESNGVCNAADTILITYFRQPSAHADVAPGYNQFTCDTIVQLAADTTNSFVSSGLWFSNPPVDFTTPTEDSTYANVANMNYGSTSARDVVFYWLVSNGVCNDIDSTHVTFYETPVADAGEDTVICGPLMDLYADLSIANSVGQWHFISGPATLNIVDPTNPHSNASAPQYGVYTLEWRESNATSNSCSSRDTIVIEFLEDPNPDAGATQEICGGWAQLNANTSVGDGVWIYPSGIGMSDQYNGTINNNVYDSLYNAWITNGNQNDTVVMYWREANGRCVEQDSVTIIFWEDQVAQLNMNLQDSVQCGRKYIYLSGFQPNEGIGYWVDSSYSSTIFYPGSQSAHPDSTIVDYYGNHVFWWVVHNGMCRDTTIGVPVRFIQKPIANAGGIVDTTCGDTYHLHAIPSVGTGRWLNMVNTTFSSTDSTYGTSPTDTVTTSVLSFDHPGEYYYFVWFEETDANCTDRDTIKILFAGQPTAAIDTVIKALCVGESFQIIAETDPTIDPSHPSLFHWDMDGGTVDTTGIIPNYVDSIYNPIVVWNNGDEEHVVELISENKYGCKSPIQSITVKEPPALDPTFDQESATCGQSNGIGYLLTDNNYYSFSWVDTTDQGAWLFPDPYNPSVPSSDTMQSDLAPGIYLIAVRGEQRADTTIPSGHFCYDTIQFVIDDVGYIDAQFDTNTLADGIAPYTINIINTTQDGNKFYWYVYTDNDSLIETSTDQNPEFTFEHEGNYWIKYIVISKDGCSDTTQYKFIKVDAESLLEVPNIFTPNGDGVNDYFKVHYKTLATFNGVILNRWGRKVFEWTDPDVGWNGKIDGTKGEAPTGVYYYIIKATGQDEKTYDLQGTFHLVRTK